MTTYSTNLKTWGDTGTEYPNSYSYAEGEQPVDDWDNFFNSNVVSDIEAVIGALNDDVVQVDGSNDIAGTLSFSSGNLDLNETARIVNLDTEVYALEWNLDEAGTTAKDWGAVGFTDPNNANIKWMRNAAANWAFRVENDDNGDSLFIANDGGLVEVPSGSLEVGGRNVTLGAADNFPSFLLQASGTDKADYSWNNAGPYARIRNFVDTSDWLRLKPSTHADGKRVDVLETLHLGGSLDVAGNAITDSTRGFVELAAGEDLRLATGNSIEDENGTKRLKVDGSGSRINDEAGTLRFQAADGGSVKLFADSRANIAFFDTEGSFNALDYSPSTTAPGKAIWNANTFIKNGAGLVVGDTTGASIGGGTQAVQIVGGTVRESDYGLARYSADVNGPRLAVGKSRSSTVGTAGTAVQSGDVLFNVRVHGDDGTDLNNTATWLRSVVDGTVGTDQVPGRFEFHTTDPAGALTEALRINSSQQILAAQDGSASAPAISFTGDTDTGILRRAEDNIAIVTGGVRRWQINSSGSLLNVSSGSLNIGGQSIINVGGTTDASAGALRLGSGTQSVYARDATSAADYGLDFAENAGSPYVGVAGADLRLATGQSIEDGGGNTRFRVSAGSTAMYYPDGSTTAIVADTDKELFLRAPSGNRLRVWDDEGSFTAIDYTTTASAPGTLELTNAVLQADHGVTDAAGNTMLDSVAATGQVTLSGGVAEIDTNITATDATFQPALGVDDPNADVEVSARLFWDDSDGSYHIRFVEQGTSVGNPTVNYDIIRVR